MIIKFVTVSCLLILILEVLFVVISIVIKQRPQRIAFLRSFKKGKCAIIYITAIPLYCIGIQYEGQSFLNALFSSIRSVINLIVLQYDTESIQALMQNNELYNFTIYFCFILVGINAIIFTASLTSQYIWCGIQLFKAMSTKNNKLFLLGNNAENISIYLSDKNRNKVIIDDISNKDCENLYMENISFISTNSYEHIIQKIFRYDKKIDIECIIIINTSDDEKNITICQFIINVLRNISENIREHLFFQIKIFVFGNPIYETIYENIVSMGFGCINYVNKYQKIAIDFIDKYPLSKFMTTAQIDYETSLIKNNVDINVFLIGFGQSNQQLFLTSVANNQFLTDGSSDPELKKVKYFIFDKFETENNKNLNHNYYRYKYECLKTNSEEFLPLPSLPAEEAYYHLNINDCEFYNRIKNIATKNAEDLNFIIIAFGTDFENIDMAQKFVAKRKEWELDNLVIFVKSRRWHKEQILLDDKGCYFIGNENDAVYNIDRIIGDSVFRMAQMRNEIYDLEYAITSTPGIVVDAECIKNNHDAAYKNWYLKKTQMERESSLYCCLSLRSKLILMGLDYCEIKDTKFPGISEEEYLSIYAGNDMLDTSKYDMHANGKSIVHYTLDFPPSRRRNLAILEHYRWNSFMITKGMIPSSISQIVSEKQIDDRGKEKFSNGKNYQVRRHGNLTTFDGLIEFRKILAARDNCSEEEKDVIKYDYQLLDDAYWLLQSNGYKIIKRVKF